MAKIKQNIFILIFLCSFGLNAQELVLGADRIEQIISVTNEKSIAIVGNQTSMVNKTHLVDTLLSLNQKIITVFTRTWL